MIKLLIVIPSLSIGGAQRFCLNIVNQICDREISYEIVALRRLAADEPGMEKEFSAYSQHLTLLDCKKVVLSLPKLFAYIGMYKPNVILSTVNNVDYWISVVKRFFPKTHLIIRKANVIFNTTRADSLILKSKLPYKFADKIVVLTRQMREIYLEDGVSEDKLVVINNMVNVDDPRIVSARSHRKGGSGRAVNIVNVARMVPEKRHDLMIEAFIRLCQTNDECTLTLVGGGPEEGRLRELLPEALRERVIFAGFQSNPYEYMARGDIFCLTSDFEGFPNVIIEAFVCGLPVVATDCPTGPREIVEPGFTGYLANKGDSASIYECLRKLTEDEALRREMSKNALSVVKNYSPGAISEQYFRLFREVIEG